MLLCVAMGRYVEGYEEAENWGYRKNSRIPLSGVSVPLKRGARTPAATAVVGGRAESTDDGGRSAASLGRPSSVLGAALGATPPALVSGLLLYLSTLHPYWE